MQTVTLLHAPLSADDAWPWLTALLHALPYAKRIELERLQPADTRATLAGLALLMLGASRIRAGGITARQLVFAAGCKPRCAGGPCFSVSHTPGRVVCAISLDMDPGVDIESSAATGEEREKLRRWTATEAALKAAGLGVRNVAEVRLDPGFGHAEIGSRRYVLLEPRLADGYICHVATPDAPRALEICAVDLDGPEISLAVERSLGFTTQAK